jgi:hypothetical protein
VGSVETKGVVELFPAEHLCRRAVAEDAPIEEDKAVRIAGDAQDIVSHQDDGEVVGFTEGGNEPVEELDSGQVHPRDRLVEKEDPGLLMDEPGQGDLLLVPARQVADLLGGAIGLDIHFPDPLAHGPALAPGDGLFLFACLTGGLVAAFTGLLVGLPSIRLRGDYLAIVTLGFGEIVRVILQSSPAQLETASEIGGTSWPLALSIFSM